MDLACLGLERSKETTRKDGCLCLCFLTSLNSRGAVRVDCLPEACSASAERNLSL